MRRYLAHALFIVLSFTIGAQAALPFLTAEDRFDYAKDIIEGRVIQVIETNTEKYAGYSDYHYEATIAVTKVLKGDQNVGSIMTFHYWSVAERPEGMCGDNGQFMDIRNGLAIRAGKTIRLFSYETEEGHQLLNPNGFDIVASERQRLTPIDG